MTRKQQNARKFFSDPKADPEILKRTLFVSPDARVAHELSPSTGHKVAFIGSEYTCSALKGEVEVILLTPANWKLLVDNLSPEILLVESTFDSAVGGWGSAQQGDGPLHQVLLEVVRYCQARSIPAIFWNTSSFEYHEYFKKVAGCFDHIFYADHRFLALIAEEHYLPVAVQPKIFNPLIETSRNQGALYDGIVDVLRRAPLAQGLLDHFSSSGLVLIDSVNSILAEKCEQLELLKPQVLGSVHPRDRVHFLRDCRYEIRAFQGATTTVCQQRCLEAAACKTLVLHGGLLGDADVRRGLVAECRPGLDVAYMHAELENNAKEYQAAVLAAWRRVNLEHCLAKRLQHIYRQVGLEYEWCEYPLVTVVSPTNRMHQLDQVLDQFEAQLYPSKELRVMINGSEVPEEFRKRCEKRNNVFIHMVPDEKFTGFCLKAGYGVARGDYCLKIDDDDYYGEHYILDLMLHQRAADATFFGQPPGMITFEGDPGVYHRAARLRSGIVINSAELKPGRTWIGGNTIAGKTEAFRQLKFDDSCFGAGDTALLLAIQASGERVGIYPQHNMAVVRKADKENHHTWVVATEELKASCRKSPFTFAEMKYIWEAALPQREQFINAAAPVAAEKVTYSVASIPEREHQLFRTLASIIGQADQIHVYLNNYDRIPEFLEHEKITVTTSREHGDLAAAGKFFCLDRVRHGYLFTIDDDIVYPPDYTQKMVAALKKYDNRAALCVHSSIFGHPLEWYFERTAVFGLGYGMKEDRFVTLAGTGCLAFYRPAMTMEFGDFFPDVMCDLRFSMMAIEQGMAIISVARPPGWLRPQEKLSDNTYYDWMLVDDGNRTKVARSMDWSFTAYARVVDDWLRPFAVKPEQAAKYFGLDRDFFRSMSRGQVPRLWNCRKRKLFLRRKLQYYRIQAMKKRGERCDNVQDLYPRERMSRRALRRQIEKIKGSFEGT